MIILIDNYDSFVYNLARYVGQLGYERAVYRHDKITLRELAELQPSHIILSPGPCAPDQAGICLELIKTFASTIPILGVCLGHQAIGQCFGGRIKRASKPMHGMSAIITHNGRGIFQGLPKQLSVARYHSLIVERASLPDCLEVTAVSDENEIMALQHKHYPVIGVQFHPESILTDNGYQLLDAFLKI
jgi:anthranilate synthase/aminodeoxychorismate synthase-like glutamine amidotransferase